MSQNKEFDEPSLRKELSKLSKLQLIKKCKQDKVSISYSKKAMIDGLIQKYKKKQSSKAKKKKNGIIKAIQTKKRKSLKLRSNREKLLKLYQTADESEHFFEFVMENSDKFVVSVIDIILDKTAVSKDEDALSTMLFHQFRNDARFWFDLKASIQNTLKRRLLNGITALDGTDKVAILAHIIAVIASFEEWNELIPHLTDLNSGKQTKLKILAMIAGWIPDRFEVHTLQIANAIYAETLNIDESNIDSHESASLFRIISAVCSHRNIEDVALLLKIMKTTLVFMLKVYVGQYEELKLFDTSFGNDTNINKSVWNLLILHINAHQSYDTADTCFRLLCQLYFVHFDAIPAQLHEDIFFLLNVFLTMNAEKMEAGFIRFAADRQDWDEDQHHFAMISQFVFGILSEMQNKKDSANFDFYSIVNCNLIENIVRNIDYDIIHEEVYAIWLHLLNELDVRHFWHQKSLLVPLLQQKHPSSTYDDCKQLKDKLYEQEWFAVNWFIRNNYSKLYDEITVPVTQIVLKYLSEYASIDIVRRECDDYFARMAAKQNANVLQESVESVIEALRSTFPDTIIKEICSHLSYTESSMEEEIMSNYILAPILDQVVPCIVISTLKDKAYEVFNYNLASIQFKLGWFACVDDKNKWPKDGKYCFC